MNQELKDYKKKLAARRYEELIRTANLTLVYLDTFAQAPADEVNFYDSSVELQVHSLKKLHSVRRFLKELFPSYKDSLIYIGAFDNTNGYARYKVDTNIESIPNDWLSIMLISPIESWPLKTNKGCGFKKVVRTAEPYETYTYTCDKEQP